MYVFLKHSFGIGDFTNYSFEIGAYWGWPLEVIVTEILAGIAIVIIGVRVIVTLSV